MKLFQKLKKYLITLYYAVIGKSSEPEPKTIPANQLDESRYLRVGLTHEQFEKAHHLINYIENFGYSEGSNDTLSDTSQNIPEYDRLAYLINYVGTPKFKEDYNQYLIENSILPTTTTKEELIEELLPFM